eukprot:Plantae.Rhodophyta-Purpureofilum_apyrenoidigerum.ctg4802.p1 GENE.Plantae.Rhodophyta-Purpureofilum_apyrenoidigerum.ctg4802~~Plantae.Rhodophyta-Purpureofilum_apyrenoidigerum.ctg4802.p1  ORF type:complete len:356 (+),score=72.81 Plantae.Rhodophyta-Purpureofilum_apyrenoidigerum.ctg4802:97-1164(+)
MAERMDRIVSSSNPWVEKYRPAKISDVAHQKEVVAALEQAVARGGGNLPHLLFYGPPGTGKTSLALALVRQIFPGDLYRQRVMELNASDERGIRVVREKIKVFAQGVVAPMKTVDNKPVPPFKIIILDEADAVTGEAQTALRRTMESFSKITRFILICNYISRIIAPLASRCAKFRFQPLPVDASIERLQFVCREEKLKTERNILEEIVLSTNGDLRKALTTLQSAHRMVDVDGEISSQHVDASTGKIPDEVVTLFRDSMRATSTFELVKNAVDSIVRGGYPADRLLHQLADKIADESYDALNELQKSALMIKLANAEHRLGDGASERLQLLDVGAKGLTISKAGGDSIKRMFVV